MKQLAILLIICISAGCSSSRKISSDSFPLNGNWMPEKQEFAGTALPSVSFKKQILTLKDSTYTLVAESTDKGIVRYGKGKMDIYGKEGVNAGKHFTAIYKLGSGQLTICYNLAGNNYPESFETSGKPLFFLSVFKKK